MKRSPTLLVAAFLVVTAAGGSYLASSTELSASAVTAAHPSASSTTPDITRRGTGVTLAARPVAASATVSSTTPPSERKATRAVAATATVHLLVRSRRAERTAYLKRMYAAVVPPRERAMLAGHYVLGYDLAGMACGTGCSGLFGNQARSSFDAAFFGQPVRYQRNILAHEAAHAYGFLYIHGYAIASWSRSGGWQQRFHRLDRRFVGTYDAEAWASCVAWKESGFNNRVNQISSTCRSAAATLAMSRIG